MSAEGGKYSIELSRDHKPNDELETKRIQEAGGRIYQTQTVARIAAGMVPNMPASTEDQLIIGPYRVFPGRLSVSRTFGDIEAKKPRYGGNPKVIIADPEIKAFRVSDSHDYIVLACKVFLF